MKEAPQSASETVEVVDGVHLTQLAVGERMSAQHFHIEPGSSIPEHSHSHEQVGFVSGGTFHFLVADEEYVIGSGDSYVVPAEERHAVANRTDEPVRGVDVFSPPREAPDWQDG